MVAAFVRALATVLLMGRVAVLYRYRAVPVALLCAQGRRPASPTALCTRGRRPASPAALCTRGRRPASPAALCTRGRRPARSPSTPRAFGSARRLEARPGPAAALGCRSLPHAEGFPAARPWAPQSPRAARSPHRPPRPRSHPWQSVWLYTYKIAGTKRSRRFTVGVAGFEPTASSSRTKRATKLRHTPVPNEYSHTSSENPNRDRRTMGSVCHAAKMSVR